MPMEVVKQDVYSNPYCPHGPTILFKRSNGNVQEFYSCSAYRDRKMCSFYLQKDEIMSNSSKEYWLHKRKELENSVNHKKMYKNLLVISKSVERDRTFCVLCGTFVLNKNSSEHSSHTKIVGITDDQLKNPMQLLKPLQNNKGEAQYLFTQSTLEVLRRTFVNLSIAKLLCVGTPTLFEYIRKHEKEISTFLLDLDKRFHNFYNPEEFSWYNCINNYFFLPKSRKQFQDFLRGNSDNTALIIDPPFGIRLELLSFTIQELQKQFRVCNNEISKMTTFIILPYFMESHMKNWLPQFKMVDYKIEYQNHKAFNNEKSGRKSGSPVRIFTDIDLKLVVLPEQEGYKYCRGCERYVSAENKHCLYCDSCTSKDGKTYVHCHECNKCVKPTWTHCKTCKKCTLIQHSCYEEPIFERDCFTCKRKGHKRSQCPLEVNLSSVKLKKRRKK